MLKALLTVLHLFVSVAIFEFAGAVALVAGVWLLTGEAGWALVTFGVLALLKAFDLALEKGAP